MGDDNSVHIIGSQQFVDAFSQFQPNFVGHVFAGDLRNLFAADIGYFLEFWDIVNERVHGNYSGRVANSGSAGGSRAGNSAACGKNFYVGQMIVARFCGKGYLHAAEEDYQDS